MRRNRRVKIVATLGPASSEPETIRRLFEAGADVFRINMSHASRDKLTELVRAIRKIEADVGRPIGILVDLQGPKLRVGEFAEERAALTKGDVFCFDTKADAGDKERVFLPHPEIFDAVAPGHTLILDDGKLRMTVREATKEKINGRSHRRWIAVEPQGHFSARHCASFRSHDRQGQGRP